MSNDPFSFGGSYTPEEAQAAITYAYENPVIAKITSANSDGFGGLRIGWQDGRSIGNVRIEDQTEKPTNPGIRGEAVSTYGKIIPISMGKRRLAGNIIQSSDMVPKLIGTYEYDVEYQVPIYEDPFITGWVLEGDFEHDETERVTHTVRVTNPNDPAQFVDVEVVDDVTFKNPRTGVTNRYLFDNS